MSKPPIIRQTSIPGLLAILFLMAVLHFSGIYLLPEHGQILAICIFFVLLFGLREIPRDHRRGIKLIRHQKYADAIPCFLRSFEYFCRHLWLDRFRAIFLLSASAISYREMALLNVGFCYSQIGDGPNAKKYYQECLELFPDSGFATAALRMLNATNPGEETMRL
jgi:tetratricopeptide (TPR) repeat protein